MRCPRCHNENPDDGRFCTTCGLPLSQEAADDPTWRKSRKPSKVGGFVLSVLKAACYVILFLMVQSGVIGAYSGYYSMGLGTNVSPYDLYDMVIEAVYSHLSVLTLISGVLTILILAIFFALRQKSLITESRLTPVSPKSLLLCALIGTALNVVVSVTISLLPLPEAWFEGLEDQYAYLGESNIWLELLSTAVVTGLLEEMIFRGLAETRLRRGMPRGVAMVGSALIFGLCHGTPIAIGYATLLGLLFSILDRRYDSILPSVVTHMFFNACGLWFVTEDTLLILAMYLICGGVLLGSLYLYFRRKPEDDAVEEAKTEEQKLVEKE